LRGAQWIPDPLACWNNYKGRLLVRNVLDAQHRPALTVFAVVAAVLATSLTAYSFARLRWPGRRVVRL